MCWFLHAYGTRALLYAIRVYINSAFLRACVVVGIGVLGFFSIELLFDVVNSVTVMRMASR